MNHVIVTSSMEQAERFQDQLEHNALAKKLLLFPSLEDSPYGQVIPSQKNMMERFHIYHTLATSTGPYLVLVTPESFLLKGPGPEFFRKHCLSVQTGLEIPPDELALKLINLGYKASPLANSPGTFSRKGEIFDIHQVGGPPVRLHYFDDLCRDNP